MTRFDVSRERFANRGKNRGATVIRFRLSRAARLVLVVRGPGPSCELVARVAFRGRAGANRIRFDGRIDRRPLEPGTYLLTPRRRGGSIDLGRAFVTIVDPDRPRAEHVRPQCADEITLGRSFRAGEEGVGGSRRAQPGPSAAGPASPSAPAPPPAREGVRGEESPLLADPPWPRVFADPDGLPTFLGIAVLALLVVSLLGILVEVVRHLRSPQV